MENLYCPWREHYSTKIDNEKKIDTKKDECPFCAIVQSDDDAQHFVLGRYKHNFVLLNLYPYNAGHLLVLPYEHADHTKKLSQAARAEMMELAHKASTILEDIAHAQGINIGLNMGKEAGAGIPSHVHIHVLPRWRGDTNFMPILAKTKHISFDLQKIYQDLQKAFQSM